MAVLGSLVGKEVGSDDGKEDRLEGGGVDVMLGAATALAGSVDSGSAIFFLTGRFSCWL
jgi:hypothetical protein